MARELCLVTGGAGFIASHVAEALLNEKYPVRIFDNLSAGKLSNIRNLKGDLAFQKGDIRKQKDVEKAMRGVKYAFHLAANRAVGRSVDNPLETNETNVTGTLRMLLAARDNKVKRFVFTSSSSVYGETHKFPLSETDLPRPESPYAASKIMGEYYCRQFTKLYGLETVSLRYFNVYGPRQNPESMYSAVIPILLDCLVKGIPPEIHWDGKQSRDFIHVKDVARANLCAMKQKGIAGEVFNVGIAEELSVLDVLRALQEILNIPNVKPVFKPKRKGDVRRTIADMRLARKRLKFRPEISFKTGLEDTVEWFLRERLRGR